MLDQQAPAMVDDEAALERWAERYRASNLRATDPGARPVPETLSGLPVDPLYTPQSLRGQDYARTIGYPGEFPYTRGVYPSMYRDKLFTMRQFAGFGSAAETNQRYRFLLAEGQTGLSVAFDLPTLMGRDSDDPAGQGEVGRCGVAIDSLEDMDQLLAEIDLAKVTTSMTINSPAAVMLAMYVAVAERRGVPLEKLGGTLQNDILKEYIAQKEYIFPPQPSLRLVTDVIAFCAHHVPKWHPVSISGYHIREAGSTAVQELAFTLADGFAYVEAGVRAGLAVDEFAPQLSFFFNSHVDFFEEVAKYRAARRIWARRMRGTYGARDERSWLLRFHTQTAGCSLTAQQVENNIARTALEALAAVLGGTQSLHTNAMDEVLALPTAKAAQIALRTQQIIAFETGVAATIDPLGGSFFVEDLTNRMEMEAEAYFAEIDARGGVLACIESGFFQSEIADAAFRYQQQLDRGERIVVGVNAFTSAEDVAPPLLQIDPAVEAEQIARLANVRRDRDGEAVRLRLEALREAAQGPENLMPKIIDAVRALCTEGEITATLTEVFGGYREPAVF
ncbi:MAG TPA: methylmalonyl-CoA mutase family protein [Candidatus Dormibacteraeota bacterium]|nr:methylmalonyl-CoA mutase family protein [Candidatus Dormibacteraeota bacterium]